MQADTLSSARIPALGIWLRVVPLLMAAMFFAYLDRVNLGFAALTLNRDLGLTNTQFGTAAGVFALGYALAGIPSTLMLHRWGARRWISLTMLLWGLCSAATALVRHPAELLGVRLFLGMAEASLAPGTVVYLSQWFPGAYRGRVLGTFYMIIPVSQFMGGPLSSVLLAADGRWGLAGWQWLFIVEALPTLVLAAIVFQFLPEAPAQARWLSAQQQRQLTSSLAAEQPPGERKLGQDLHHTFRDRRVWLLAAFSAGLGTSGIGAILFLPLIVRSMGFSVWATGFVSSIPPAVAVAVMPLFGIWADRSNNRALVVAAGCWIIAGGLWVAAFLLPSPWAIAPLSIALAAFFGCLPAFWTLPAAFLTGAGAAAGIAFINITGNLGQFAGPYILGKLADSSRSYTPGLSGLGVIAAVSAALLTVGSFRNLVYVRQAR